MYENLVLTILGGFWRLSKTLCVVSTTGVTSGTQREKWTRVRFFLSLFYWFLVARSIIYHLYLILTVLGARGWEFVRGILEFGILGWIRWSHRFPLIAPEVIHLHPIRSDFAGPRGDLWLLHLTLEANPIWAPDDLGTQIWESSTGMLWSLRLGPVI